LIEQAVCVVMRASEEILIDVYLLIGFVFLNRAHEDVHLEDVH